MAVDAPLLTRQRIFAAKVETTTGTAISLAAADGAMNIFDSKIEPVIPFGDRRGQSALSRLPGVPGARMANVSCKSELYGKGASGVPLWASTLLAASGFGVSGSTYSPASGSSSYTSLTVGSYIDGRWLSAAGCVFDWTLVLESGKPGMFDFKGQGVYVAPSAVALIAPTYPTVIPPRFAGATLTFGGTSYKVSRLEIACNNVIAMRQDATTASGYFAGVITDRRITVKANLEALALGTKDWYADYIAGTTAALSCAVGASANNTMTIAAPVLQLMNPPAEGDLDGVLLDNLEFQACRSASAGDDELTIAFS